MTLVDFLAMAALVIGGAALALRGYMLKPAYLTWVNAPGQVSFALVGLAIVLVGRALSIYGGGHATAGEMVVDVALAASAVVLLGNLVRQKPPEGVLGHVLDAAARAIGLGPE